MKKRIFALLLVFVLLFSFSSFAEVSFLDETVKNTVLSEELLDIMEKAADDQKIPVDIWFEEIDVNQVESMVKTKTGINRTSIQAAYVDEQLGQKTVDQIEAEQIDRYIETERAVYSELQIAKHTEFLNSFQKSTIFSKNASNDKLFISQYAPLISISVTKSEIITIVKDRRVLRVDYNPQVFAEDELATTIPTVKADVVRDNYAYTGKGVKVGIIEADGLPIATYLPVIECYPNMTTSSAHAMMVAFIIAGKPTYIKGNICRGVAPDVTLYATYIKNGVTQDWRECVEWLLSKGVNIINMSAGLNSGDGQYGSEEKWVDHIAINHSVHFVKSAGNSGWEISAPGNAYNAITVGGINDNNTVFHSDDIRYPYSSYIEAAGLTNKPDLCAPAEDVDTPSYGTPVSGTSIATPHITGVIAQLLERKPELKTLQGTVKAILAAASTHDKMRYYTGHASFNEMGAGAINADSACYIINNNRYITSQFAADGTTHIYHDYTFSANYGENIRVALSWLKYEYFSSSGHSGTPQYSGNLADLDLRVYDPSGNVVASALSAYNNLEVVMFNAPSAGQYRIRVTKATNSNRAIYYGVAWW